MMRNEGKLRQSWFHTSVLLKEAIDGLNVEQGKLYIDATVGGGGHAWEIVKRGGVLLGIDQDRKAIEFATEFLSTQCQKYEIEKNWKIIHGNFENIENIAIRHGFNRVSGILLDLGLSTFQIKQSNRGFSFQSDELLDMRMDAENESNITAYTIINKASRRKLYEIFTTYGEEHRAWTIVHAIDGARSVRPIETSGQLKKIILDAISKTSGKTAINPVTRSFQAIRIAVNRELTVLEKAIPQVTKLLKPGGVCAVISFHSLEDRLVKLGFRKCSLSLVTKKPIRPTLRETTINPQARSAKLRIGQKQ